MQGLLKIETFTVSCPHIFRICSFKSRWHRLTALHVSQSALMSWHIYLVFSHLAFFPKDLGSNLVAYCFLELNCDAYVVEQAQYDLLTLPSPFRRPSIFLVLLAFKKTLGCPEASTAFSNFGTTFCGFWSLSSVLDLLPDN